MHATSTKVVIDNEELIVTQVDNGFWTVSCNTERVGEVMKHGGKLTVVSARTNYMAQIMGPADRDTILSYLLTFG